MDARADPQAQAQASRDYRVRIQRATLTANGLAYVDVTLDERVIGYLRSLAQECKSCRFRGASCSNCLINGADQLLDDMTHKPAPIFIKRSEASLRKDKILEMLSSGPLYARDIKLECSLGVKSQTLNVMERDGEIEVVRRRGRQKLYMLPGTATTQTRNQKSKPTGTKTVTKQE